MQMKMPFPTLTRALYYFSVFASWTVTSYLCHLFAKMFLTLFTKSFGINFWISLAGAVTITLIQTLMCFSSIKLNDEKKDNQKLTNVSLHALATFFTNLSMAVMFASSTLAIKLMEPITSAMTQYFFMGTPLKATTTVSLPFIVMGAIAFTGNPLSEVSLTLGVGAAFVSNIVFAFRNVSLKKLNASDQSGIRFRTISVFSVWLPAALLVLCGVGLCLERAGVIPRSLQEAATYGFLSATFHVAYSYVSVGLVLKEMSVVSHAVLNILKRLLVVVLLYISSVRVATFSNFVGLGICTFGLVLYSTDQQILKFCSERIVKFLSIFVLITFLVTSTRLTNVDFNQILKSSSYPAMIGRNSLNRSVDGLHILSMGFNQPTEQDLLPDLSGYTARERREIQDFLGENMAKNSTRSNFLSQQLRTSLEVIKETQRIHYNIFKDVLGSFKYGMLLDTADFENKGDPAITTAEIYFLARIKLDLIYYCNSAACTKTNLVKAAQLAQKYSPKDLVILLHGGGNINGYEWHDHLRFKLFDLFKGFQFFLFPQSIWLKPGSGKHQEFCRKMYCCHENLTMVLRDSLSYSIAEKFFKGATRLLMAPDIVFHLGPVKRTIAPVFDILWIQRTDKEGPKYNMTISHPPHLRLHVSDWYLFITPRAGTSLEKSMYATMMGLFYIQRARVVITDRLHGHILSTLLDIPHVLVDNPAKKLFSYHDTWTRGVKNVRFTTDPTQAVGLALELLELYKTELPPRAPWLNISETFRVINYTLPETGFS